MYNLHMRLILSLIFFGLSLSSCSFFARTPQELIITPVILETPTTAPSPSDTPCTKIALVITDGVNSEIYTVCPDGSLMTNLTDVVASDTDPAWSPDGKRIAFTSSRDGSSQIYVMDADGKYPMELTSDYVNDKPVWLPDGERIAFRTYDGIDQWWWRIVDLTSFEITEYSPPSYDPFFQTPAWSPDGSQLAYMSLVEQQERTIHRLQAELTRIKSRLAQYEPEIQRETSPAGGSAEVTQYSLQAEEKRRRHRKRKKRSPGRRKTCLKFADAQRGEDVYPEKGRRAECLLARERAVWRLENGRAVLVGYRIFRAPGGDEPPIPGVTPRCEYGIEILVVLAFLVYVIGVSLDKACRILHFFCQLPLGKSQADALLRQLARHWEGEFDALCDLLAHAAVVHMDETGWKIGKEGCSLWTFASELQRVFLFGCHKDSATLDEMLPPGVFQGVGISDDAAVYRHRFVRAQKCWAHLLRKAIRLALLYPRKKSYQRFLDRLLELYYDAKRPRTGKPVGPVRPRQAPIAAA